MNKKEIVFFAGCIILGMVISVILSKTSIRDKTHEFKCVSIQDYEGGDYSPEHYYMKEELKSFIFLIHPIVACVCNIQKQFIR